MLNDEINDENREKIIKQILDNVFNKNYQEMLRLEEGVGELSKQRNELVNSLQECSKNHLQEIKKDSLNFNQDEWEKFVRNGYKHVIKEVTDNRKVKDEEEKDYQEKLKQSLELSKKNTEFFMKTKDAIKDIDERKKLRIDFLKSQGASEKTIEQVSLEYDERKNQLSEKMNKIKLNNSKDDKEKKTTVLKEKIDTIEKKGINPEVEERINLRLQFLRSKGFSEEQILEEELKMLNQYK